MHWKIKIEAEAKKDYMKLDGSLKKQVLGEKMYQKLQLLLPEFKVEQVTMDNLSMNWRPT